MLICLHVSARLRRMVARYDAHAHRQFFIPGDGRDTFTKVTTTARRSIGRLHQGFAASHPAEERETCHPIHGTAISVPYVMAFGRGRGWCRGVARWMSRQSSARH